MLFCRLMPRPFYEHARAAQQRVYVFVFARDACYVNDDITLYFHID